MTTIVSRFMKHMYMLLFQFNMLTTLHTPIKRKKKKKKKKKKKEERKNCAKFNPNLLVKKNIPSLCVYKEKVSVCVVIRYGRQAVMNQAIGIQVLVLR